MQFLTGVASSHAIIKELPTIKDNEKVQFIFSEKTGTVTACLIDNLGHTIAIKPEYIPREFREVKSALHFQALLKDAYVIAPLMDNGDPSLHVFQRCIGGGGGEKKSKNKKPNAIVPCIGYDLVKKIREIVEKGLQDIREKQIKKNALLIVGRTGAGKSLLGNLLTGNVEIVAKEIDCEFKLDPVNPIFPISHSNTDSCTDIPNVYSPPKQKYTLIDLPGFGDTRDPVLDVANLFFRKEVVKNVDKMKILLAVDWTDISKKGDYLPSTFNDMIQFLGFENAQAKELEKLANSIVLVVTHVPPFENAKIRNAVINKLQHYTTANSLSNNAKGILTKILDDTRWTVFSSPTPQGTCTKLDSERLAILSLLNKPHSHYISKADTNIQAKVIKQQEMIQTSLLTLLETLKKEFPRRFLAELSTSLRKFYTQVSGEKALQKFQKKFHSLIESNDLCTLSELLKNFQFSGHEFESGLIEEAKSFDESLQFLIGLLPDKKAYLFSYRKDWIMELGLKSQLQKWDKKLINMSSPAKVDFKDSKLSLQGYFPKTSQITSQINKYHNVKEIEIHALNTVTIDENLSGKKYQGIDVTIIAPNWEIINDRKIDLSGKDSEVSPPGRIDATTPGTDGVDGGPGAPGDNAGHFFGIGYTFSGIERLKVICKGGKGGAGQPGGNGFAGNDGEDGKVKYDFVQTVAEARNPKIACTKGWDVVGEVHKTGHWGHDQRLTNLGKPGQVGGNGGRGGIGGNGGRAGTVTFISLNDPKVSIKPVLEEGDAGTSGEAGNPGLGGYNGRHWAGTWHTEVYGDENVPDYCDWNGHVQEQPQFHPHTKTECARASTGSRREDKNEEVRVAADPQRPFNAMKHLYNYREFAIKESNSFNLEAAEIFRRVYDQHASIRDKESVGNFIDECERMEDFFTSMKNKAKCLPLYQWMSERLQAFQVPSGVRENALIQSLYTFVLSKICQLNAAKESRLIINIKGFLKRVEANITTLKNQDHNVRVGFYEKEYVDHLESKIKESDTFLKKLSEDIKASDKEIDNQIKKLVSEIEALKARNVHSKDAMDKKRVELKALIEKRKVLGFLTVTAQCIGCCFPPTGPIVAGVVNTGMTMMSNPRLGLSAASQILSDYTNGISNALRGDSAALNRVHTASLTRLRDIALANAALNIVDAPGKTEEEQLKALDKAIADINKQQDQLDKFKKELHGSLGTSLHDFVDGALQAQAALKGQSKIALEFSKLEMKRVFENVKSQIKESTKAFAAGHGFVTLIRQIEQAIDTTANIYDHIQEYEEKRMLVKYMARLAATQVEDPLIEKYKQKVQQNLVLEQYTRAIAAVRQWAFPFASFFLADCATLKQFTETMTINNLMNLVTNQLRLLQEKIKTEYTEINTAFDSFLWRGKFFDNTSNKPFYVWNFKENKREIESLLKGEEVILFADVNKSPQEMAAVKFNHIELRIKSTNTLIEERLKKRLEGLRIKMQHSGQSYYRYEGKVYQMSNDKGFCIGYRMPGEGKEPEDSNAVYKKMKKGNFMLSPYTSWAIKLEGSKNLYEEFAPYLKTIEIQLVGKGQYIIEDKALGQIKNVDQYARNIASQQQRPSYPPIFTSQDRKKEHNDDQEGNADTKKDSPTYLYQGSDVSFIVKSPTIKQELKNFHFIQGMQAEHLSNKLNEIFEYAKKGKPVFCVYNLNNIHWVTFCLLSNSKGELVTLYKDPFGNENNDLLILLNGKSKVIFHPSSEQRDGTSCEIFALENMRIMARKLNENKEDFINRYLNFEGFCTNERAKALRQGDFARFYREGVQNSETKAAERALRAQLLTQQHQSEVEEIIVCLRQGIVQDITIQSTDAPSTATRTLVIQIGAENKNLDDYHYRIKATKDITEEELQQILSTSKYGWYKDQDYRIKDGIFQIFRKIK